MTRLGTERLRLREPHVDDLDALAALYGDAEVMRYISPPGPWPAARSAAALEGMVARWADDGFGIFVVELDDAVIGDVGLLPWNPANWTAGASLAQLGRAAEIELGWTLAREHWGNGYATEAATAVRDWALVELGLIRLISLIHPENAASIRVAEKLGERHERDVVLHGETTALYALEV